MSRLSTVILVDDDARSQKALSFGFEREKVKVHAASTGDDGLRQLGSAGVKTELVIASLEGAGACDLVKQIRSRTDGLAKIPVLLLGSKAQRKAAFTAGASDFLAKPTYVKDVINLGRVLCAGKNGAASIFSGDVHDFPGMFYLVRALSAASRTGVITFVRGLRRGEVRFYQGEVTSAQAGTLHGIAAFHQLLLWTEGRFELRNEDVVRRQQIPLSPQELFED